MKLTQAREAARQWMIEEGSRIPGFRGAYTVGSTNWLPDDAELNAASDLDMMVVLADQNQTNKRHKFIYHDALLEVSFLQNDQSQSPDKVLSDYHLAPSFRTTKVMFDPVGFLSPLLALVSREYAKRHWVRQRCTNAKDKILAYLRSIKDGEAPHDQVNACLFRAGIMTHVVLVAGLRNPTVRTRYATVRELLAQYGHLEFHETILELLGTAGIRRERVSQHLATLTEIFEAAKKLIKTPFPFASDISDTARSFAFEGSLELIGRGFYREAMFWIAVTHSRCQKVLSLDAPKDLTQNLMASYQALVSDLGVSTFAKVQQRCAEIERVLPRLCAVAEEIMEANHEIEDG
jgi:hypothetical protein